MRRWLLLFLTLPVACDESAPVPRDAAAASTPIADQEILLGVAAGAEEVDFGVAFPLTVMRVWDLDLEPEPWSDRALSPLVVRPAEVTTREDNGHMEEVRHYDAYAFARGEVTVPPLVFQATDSEGSVRVASSEAITIGVSSALGEEDPGRAELPRSVFSASFPWLYWSSIGAALLAGLGLVSWYSRWRAHLPAPAPPKLPPHERALSVLQALRERQPEGVEEVKAFFVEASSLLRKYIEERFAVLVAGMTTEEFLVTPRTLKVLQPPHRETLEGFLEVCDLAKFAGHVPGQSDRTRLLSAAETFVRETCNEQEDPSRSGSRSS